ncbi:MAG TPA: hypothetical protein PKN48_12990, partial [Bacteroidales bacterium]|nr:hypothetical protein [Bacteroidales bacterium]
MKFKAVENIARLNKIEPFYFYFFLLINLIPVLSYKFFPTVDGPAHLYNSNLIVNLLQNPDSLLKDFFIFNENINPNWSGHFILSVLLLIFPGFMAEKIILLIYLIGLPLSIRYLFKTLSIENKYLIYLIFPFTYSFLFYFGFYNFNIALVLFIFGICLWLKYLNNLNLLKIIVLTIISSLICLSHLFVFAMFLMLIFMINIQDLIIAKGKNEFSLKYFTKRALLQFIPLLFGIFLMAKYLLFSQPDNSPAVYLPLKDIINLLIDVAPAKGINYGKVAIFTNWILYVLAAVMLYMLCLKIYRIRSENKFIFTNKPWLWITLATLILVFVFPDSKGAAIGFMTQRLLLFFFIFLIIWLSSQKTALWFKIIVFLLVNYVNYALVLHNFQSVSKGCELAEEIHAVADQIEPYSTVYPVVNSDYFIYRHISNYLGSDKPIIVLENYEASLEHFPLKWNYQKT